MGLIHLDDKLRCKGQAILNVWVTFLDCKHPANGRGEVFGEFLGTFLKVELFLSSVSCIFFQKLLILNEKGSLCTHLIVNLKQWLLQVFVTGSVVLARNENVVDLVEDRMIGYRDILHVFRHFACFFARKQ